MLILVCFCLVIVAADVAHLGYDYLPPSLGFEEEPQLNELHEHGEDIVSMAPLDETEQVETTTSSFEDDSFGSLKALNVDKATDSLNSSGTDSSYKLEKTTITVDLPANVSVTSERIHTEKLTDLEIVKDGPEEEEQIPLDYEEYFDINNSEEVPGHVLTDVGYIYRDPRVRY